ncbi:MAG TPA: FxsA family protein [Thermohalobaculum sp.]|nr:FxsA family protein [Thermohalobaculum sp.]
MLIFLLLVAVPIIEIALFIEVGGRLGLPLTIGVVILTAAIGAALLRTQGLATLSELQRRLAAGEDPSATLAHGAMILVAGVLLLTPGFFTDTVGLLLLTPPVRTAVIRFARSRMVVHAAGSAGVGFDRAATRPDMGPGTVDGEYEVVDPGDGLGGGQGDGEPGPGPSRGDPGSPLAPAKKRDP